MSQLTKFRDYLLSLDATSQYINVAMVVVGGLTWADYVNIFNLLSAENAGIIVAATGVYKLLVRVYRAKTTVEIPKA